MKQTGHDPGSGGSSRLSGFLRLLGAWALAFGCAVSWDAVVQPWKVFLPNAGPLGTLLGLVLGGIVMAVVAWNFHYMINHRPGPGSVYAYTSEAFGTVPSPYARSFG